MTILIHISVYYDMKNCIYVTLYYDMKLPFSETFYVTNLCFFIFQQMLTSKEKKAVMDDKMKLSEHFIIKLPDLLAKVQNLLIID